MPCLTANTPALGILYPFISDISPEEKILLYPDTNKLLSTNMLPFLVRGKSDFFNKSKGPLLVAKIGNLQKIFLPSFNKT